jgi:hypothetical protein
MSIDLFKKESYDKINFKEMEDESFDYETFTDNINKNVIVKEKKDQNSQRNKIYILTFEKTKSGKYIFNFCSRLVIYRN